MGVSLLFKNRTAKHELGLLVEELSIVSVNDELVEQAAVLAETESLRGYDAVHLAAALAVGAAVMASADVELCEAASRRGLAVANPLGGA